MRTIAILLVLYSCAGGKTSTANPQEALNESGEAKPSEAKTGEVRLASFHSESLGVDKSYYLYLPSDYDEGDSRYPVIYMLHGLGGAEDNWVKHMNLAAAADEMGLSAIVVMPDGDDSFYMNSVSNADYETCMQTPRPFGKAAKLATYCVQNARHEDYIVKDLVAHVDSTYRTIPERSARGIGGLSMGGYGALMLAMKHKDVFASSASHSGVAALLYTGPYPYVSGKGELATNPRVLTDGLGAFGALFLSIYGEDVALWRAHDPVVLAESLSDGDLHIYIDCGTEDEFRLQHGATFLHEVLKGRGVSHEFALLPGRHDSAFWSERIDDSLRFHIRYLAPAEAQPD